MIVARIADPSNFEPSNLDRRRHVLLVLDQFPQALGGGERIALRLAALLPNYGYRVSILTFFAHPKSPALLLPPCPIYELPLKRTYDWGAARGALAFRRFLQEQQVSIVQTFFESSDLWAGPIAKTLPDVKLVWSRRDMGILRTTKHKLTYRLLSAIPDAVIAVSEQVRRHCIDVDGIDEGRVHTIYNGLNLSDWKAKERSNRQEILSIATIGNIRYVKGHDLLIKAAAIVVEKYPNAHFAIAGEVLEQDYFDELTALVLRLNLTNNFQFLGPVEDLPKLLAGADVFVLPSRSEGFSNAIVEAMAASLAVVATNVGGNAEAVEEGVTGRLVPSESPELLAAALIDLIASPSTRNSMGCAGNARVRERFTTEAMMSRIASLYGTLLES